MVLRGWTPIVLALGCVAAAWPGAAHENLSEYVQHDITVEARADYIDVSVRLTFFDRHAAIQQAFLDQDGDGRVHITERKAFEAELLMEAEEALTLQANGTALDLIPLHDPELRFSTPANASQHHSFEVRLKFFARLTGAVGDKAKVDLQDAFLPDFPALGSFHVAGKEGARMTMKQEGQNLSRAAGARDPLVLTGMLWPAQPPAEPSGTKKSGE